jgi:hypothetical protein
MLRWTARVIACVALAAGLTVAVLPLWLRTGPGHRMVERVLTRLLNERVPGSVSVGALSGSVIDGLHAEEVVVRNPAGELIGRAEWMSVRWRPLALLRHREIDELTAHRPTVTLDRGRWRTPPSERSSGQSTTTIGRIVARDGRLSVRGTTFENVSGTASLHSRSNLDVHAISGHIGEARLTAYGVVGWGETQPSWVAARLAVRDPRYLAGTGEIFYTPGRLEGALDELTLVAPFATQLLGGRGSVRVQGEVRGAPGELFANAHASQGGRALRIRAQIDGPRRAASFDAVLAAGPRPIRVRARVRYAAGTLIVPTLRAAIGNSRLDGAGSVRHEALRATLTVRLAPTEARWLGLQIRAPMLAQLVLDGPRGDLVVHARARLGAARLTLKARADVTRRRGHVVAVADNVQPVQLFARAPRMLVSTALTLDGRWVRHALVAEVRVARGRLTVAGRTFDRLDGAGAVRIARGGVADIRRLSARWASRRGQPQIAARGQLGWRADRVALSAATVSLAGSRSSGGATWTRGAPEERALRIDATTPLGPLAVAAQLRRAGGDAQLARIDAQLGDSRLRGSVHFRRGRLTAALDDLLLAPALVHELVPALDPRWPIRVRGAIDGPLEALDLALRVDGGPSTTELRAQLSWPTRRFRFVGHVDTLPIAVLQRRWSHVRGTVELAGEGQVVHQGVVGTLTLRNVRGFMMTSPFYRGMADVRFDGRSAELERARVDVPGAKIGGRGHGTYGEGFHVGYGVVITDALALRHVPKTLRVLIGLNGILPGRTIEGELEQRPGEKVELSYHVLPIGFAQLKFLYRVLTGRVPTVHGE